MKHSAEKICVIIPVYNHIGRSAGVINKTLALGYPVIVVDDGSTDGSSEKISEIKGITALRHEINRGKGAALMTGFLYAVDHYDWAVTIDSDGQHDPNEISDLVNAIPLSGNAMIVGRRRGMDAHDVPWTSSFGRAFSNFWVWASGGPSGGDTQSGFRAYPLKETLNLKVKSRRFQFEVEILVKAHWRGIPIIEVPISVSYLDGERVSHFRPFIDFMRNSLVFTRLITQRILIPRFFRKKYYF